MILDVTQAIVSACRQTRFYAMRTRGDDAQKQTQGMAVSESHIAMVGWTRERGTCS